MFCKNFREQFYVVDLTDDSKLSTAARPYIFSAIIYAIDFSRRMYFLLIIYSDCEWNYSGAIDDS